MTAPSSRMGCQMGVVWGEGLRRGHAEVQAMPGWADRLDTCSRALLTDSCHCQPLVLFPWFPGEAQRPRPSLMLWSPAPTTTTSHRD